MATAKKMLEDERARHAPPQQPAFTAVPGKSSDWDRAVMPPPQSSRPIYIPDPGHPQQQPNPDRVDRANLLAFRAQIPNLSSLTDDFILNTSMVLLLKMESNSMKRGSADKARNIEERLMTNQDNLAITSIAIPEGWDDRRLNLHSSRFIPPAVCSAAELWLAARDVIGPTGLPPVSSFDMASVGLAGYATPRGWAEMHNPGSSSLSLKLVHIGNMCNRVAASRRISLADGEDALEVGDSLRDIASFNEFRHSLRAARTAMQFVYPWNFSLVALENFMLNSNFLAKDVGTGAPAVAILASFCDHVFLINAERWRARKPFLDIIELGSVWATWHVSRGVTASSGADPKTAKVKPKPAGQQSQGGGNKPHSYKQLSSHRGNSQGFQRGPQHSSHQGGHQNGQQGHQQHATGSNAPDDICGRYNKNICPNMAAPQCTMANGTVLRHVCNFRTGNNTRCEQAHQRVFNH